MMERKGLFHLPTQCGRPVAGPAVHLYRVHCGQLQAFRQQVMPVSCGWSISWAAQVSQCLAVHPFVQSMNSPLSDTAIRMSLPNYPILKPVEKKSIPWVVMETQR